MARTPGTRLGPYEVLSPIGAGGMGVVYRARDPRLGRDVAIKLLPPAFADDPDRLRRFEQEARAAAALNHPNILAVLSFDAFEAEVLSGTEGVDQPFWSPDSRTVAFVADGKLKKVEPAGGPVQVLSDAPFLARGSWSPDNGAGGSWSPDESIILGSARAGLFRVAAAGGQPAALTTLDASRGETAHRFPRFLPDGRRFLFLALRAPKTSLPRTGRRTSVSS